MPRLSRTSSRMTQHATTDTARRFPPGDGENPRSWSSVRKWTVVASIGLVDLTVSFGASGFSPASSDFAARFGLSRPVSHLGLSLYVLPYAVFLVLLALTALVDNLPGFFVLRFLSGTFASVTIANFGGTIADLFARDEVGPAMNIFLWAAVCGSPLGYFLMALVAEHHGWRTVFWTLLGICGHQFRSS